MIDHCPTGSPSGASTRLTFTVEFSDAELAVLDIAGDLDVVTVGDLSAVLDTMLAVGVSKVDVDASRVEFIDLRTITTFLTHARRFEGEGGRLGISVASPAVTRMLRLTGLSAVLSAPDGPAGASARC